MIIEEIETINGKDYKLTYSDANKDIKQLETGIVFCDALDDIKSNFTYEEVDKIDDDWQNEEY